MPCLDTLIHGECLEAMKHIADGSIDMVCADLPYGTTACKWDTVIPFEPLWEAYKRVIKPCGAIVLFGSQPFTSALVMSNPKWFRYCWVWHKNKSSGFQNAGHKPLKSHEDICIFSPSPAVPCRNSSMSYYPQGVRECNKPNRMGHRGEAYGNRPNQGDKYLQTRENYPKSVLSFAVDQGLHPTQKPVALFEYLVRTYTNPGDLVLDNTMGSGTLPVACIQSGRHYIGIEKDDTYFDIAVSRVRAREVEIALTLSL